MTQLDLFDNPHLSRRDDPETSKDAAAAVNLKADAALALRTVIANPGQTSAELERIAGVPDGKIRKRLADLVRKRFVYVGESRVCGVKGSKCQTYTATVIGDQQGE